MANPYEVKIGIIENITNVILFNNIPVSDESKIRIVIANATGGNTIIVRGRINGQLDYDTLSTIVGNNKSVINISTYDELQLECTVYGSSSDHVQVVVSSFNPAGGSTTIDAPAGLPVDSDEFIFTSSDSSISITSDPLTNTINFTQGGAADLSKYTAMFNNTSDWVLNGSNYEYTVIAALHGNKPNPVVQTFETISGTDDLVFPDIIRTSGNNIILQVSQVPDNRYNGRIIIL